MGGGGGGGSVESLPEECIARILSFTSPRDVCRASAVSSAFRSAADTNLVWDRFLPADWEDILGRCSSEPVPFSSRKELYFRLCDSIPIDDGTKRAWLERATGKKCFMLAARSLSITWGDDDRYWTWISVSDARFPEAAELLHVCWLAIEGRIRCRDLSPETRYGAYLVMRLSRNPYGLEEPPQEAVITVGGVPSSTRSVRLQEQRTCVRYPWGPPPIQIDAGVQEDEELLPEEAGATDAAYSSLVEQPPDEEVHRLPGLPAEEGNDEEEGSQPSWEADGNEEEGGLEEEEDVVISEEEEVVEEEDEEEEDVVISEEEEEVVEEVEEEEVGDMLLPPPGEVLSADGDGSSMSESLGEEDDESDGSDCCAGDGAGEPAAREPVWVPEARGDGWEELAMGDFFVEGGGGGVELVEVLLKGWQSGHWKSGLIVQGIELRPLP